MASIAPSFDAFNRLGEGLRERAAALLAIPAARRAAAIAALAAFGAFWGAAVAVADVSAALLCVSLIACIFCLRDFRAGVAFLVVLMPIAQSYAFPHAMLGITGLNPLNLLMATTLLAFVMRRAGERQAPRFIAKPLFWLYIVPFTAAGLLGMGHAGEIPSIFRELDMIYFDNAVGYMRDMWAKPLTFVVYAILVSAAVARSKDPQRFLTPMVFSVFVMAGLAVVFVAMSGLSLSQMAGTYARHFLSALGMHANDLGRLYATAYALMLFTWDRTDRWALKFVLFVGMAVVVLALLLTFSRGAFLGFILVNLIYLFVRRRLKTLAMAVLFVPVALYFMPGAFWYRITMGFGSGMNAISAGRTEEIWAPLMGDLMASPIWGQGLGSIMWSRAMINELIPHVAHPHNAYLEVYLDMGIVGAVLVIAFWIHIWRALRKEAQVQRHPVELQGFFEGAAAGLLAFLIAGMAGSSLLPDAAQVFLWLAVGVLYGVRSKYAAQAAKGE